MGASPTTVPLTRMPTGGVEGRPHPFHPAPAFLGSRFIGLSLVRYGKALERRHVAGAVPKAFLNAREKAASDS